MFLTCAACFVLTVASAVMPWVNAEIVLLSFTTAASSLTVVGDLVVRVF